MENDDMMMLLERDWLLGPPTTMDSTVRYVTRSMTPDDIEIAEYLFQMPSPPSWPPNGQSQEG